MKDTVKISVDKKLLDKAYGVISETRGLTYTGLVDFLIRKVLKQYAKEYT